MKKSRPKITRVTILELFDHIKDRVTPIGIPNGILFRWSSKGIGWGELTLQVVRGKLVVDSECCGLDFCAGIVKQAIEQALTEQETD